MSLKNQYVTVRYSYIDRYQNRDLAVETGFITKNEDKQKVIKIDNNNSNTYSLVISDNTESRRLYQSKFGKRVSKINVKSYRIWESKNEIQVFLPRIDSSNSGNSKLFLYGKLINRTVIIKNGIFCLTSNNVDISLEVEDRWSVKDVNIKNKGTRFYVKNSNDDINNSLVKRSELYLLSDNKFNNVNIE